MSILGKELANGNLSKPTTFFGLKLWVVLVALCCTGTLLALLLLLSLLWFSTSRSKKPSSAVTSSPPPHSLVDPLTPPISKEIPEVLVVTHPPPPSEIQIDLGGKGHRVVFGDYLSRKTSGSGVVNNNGGASSASGGSRRSGGDGPVVGPPEVSHLGWGHWYTLRELEEATDELSPDNVIGEGGYGIVYRGVLHDGTIVAVKNLLNNRGQAEREFKVEVEAIGRVRHKNLVRLLGYCAEGAYRMLVYEYVDNGNLDQWLHGDVGQVSPLTWEIRMNIILGTAKGLAYLHEGLEPKVVHRDVKSSNILLDRQWHPKVSDFGLAKLLGSETNHVTTRVMGTFGYVAPEYASTGMLNERSDLYSFGVLIMEIITARAPVDYNRTHDEVHLVEWLKRMVVERRSEEVLDPKIPERPSPKALKRALLVALRCVDPDARKRPKMGHIIHMLEMDDLLFPDERKQQARQESASSNRDSPRLTLKKYDLNGREINAIHGRDPTNWR